MANVTPYAGVWIEILYLKDNAYTEYASLPTRECGLKFICFPCTCQRQKSLPTRECGLKFCYLHHFPNRFWVTPYAGVWIEIYANHGKKTYLLSLPTRECGLKYFGSCDNGKRFIGHSLRGSVD